jgi:hypothetical protein
MKVGSPPICGPPSLRRARPTPDAGKPSETKLDGREGNEGAQSFGKVLEVLGERRFRPNQEKVRSTTHRRGRTTKPLLSSDRLTISMRKTGILATAASTCHTF